MVQRSLRLVAWMRAVIVAVHKKMKTNLILVVSLKMTIMFILIEIITNTF